MTTTVPESTGENAYDYSDRRIHIHSSAANVQRWRATAKNKGESASSYIEQCLLDYEAGDSAEVTRLRKLLEEERIAKEAAQRAHMHSTQEVMRLTTRLEAIEDHLLDVNESQLRRAAKGDDV